MLNQTAGAGTCLMGFPSLRKFLVLHKCVCLQVWLDCYRFDLCNEALPLREAHVSPAGSSSDDKKM